MCFFFLILYSLFLFLMLFGIVVLACFVVVIVCVVSCVCVMVAFLFLVCLNIVLGSPSVSGSNVFSLLFQIIRLQMWQRFINRPKTVGTNCQYARHHMRLIFLFDFGFFT